MKSMVRLCWAMGLAAACCGCGQSNATPHATPNRHAPLHAPTVSAVRLLAGESLQVDCTANAEASPTAAPPTSRSVAADGRAQSGVEVVAQVTPSLPLLQGATPTVAGITQFVATRAGAYTVHCSDAMGRRRSASVAVEIVANKPVRLAVQMPSQMTSVGESLPLVCIGLDAMGNMVTPPANPAMIAPTAGGVLAMAHSQRVADYLLSSPARMSSPAQGATSELTAWAPGDIQVRCTVPAWGELGPSDPVTVHVRAGQAVRVEASLDPGPLVAGEPWPVRCVAFDASGHSLTAATHWQLDEGPGSLRHALDRPIAEKSGTYVFRCVLVGDDGEKAAVSEPLTATVAAGPAVDWRVWWWPPGPCLEQNRQLPLQYKAYDRFGNYVGPIDVSLQADPPGRIERNAVGGFVFPDEGTYDITLKANGALGDVLRPWRQHVVIDSTPPRIVLQTPPRAGMVEQAERKVTLEGYVTDAHCDIVSLVIDGQSLPVGHGPDQRFSLEMNARWGLNVVRGEAIDACGNSTGLDQSFLLSSKFAPLPDGNDRLRLPGALVANLAQPLWDADDKREMHDVRSLIELALINGGLNERLPEQLWMYPQAAESPNAPASLFAFLHKDYDHTASHVAVVRDGPLSMAAPIIEYLQLQDGGFGVSVVLRDIVLPVRLQQILDLVFTDKAVAMPAVIEVSELKLQANARIFMRDGKPTSEICADCVQMAMPEGMPKIRVSQDKLSWFGQLVSWPMDWLLHGFRHYLADLVRDRVRQDIARELERILRGLKLEHAQPLPNPLTTTMHFESGLDDVQVFASSPNAAPFCQMSLYYEGNDIIDRDRPEAMLPGDEPLYAGPIRAEGISTLPAAMAPDGNDSFAIGLSDNLLNQILWQLWVRGSFNHDDLAKAFSGGLAEQSAQAYSFFEAAKFSAYFLAPPVVMPSSEPGEIRIGVADVYMETDTDTMLVFGQPAEPNHRLRARFYLSFEATIKLGVDAEGKNLRVLKVHATRTHVQVVEQERRNHSQERTLTDFLEKNINQLMPGWLEQGVRHFPLPILQIGRLPGVPNDAAWALENVSVERPANAQFTALRGQLTDLPLPSAVDIEAAEVEAVP